RPYVQWLTYKRCVTRRTEAISKNGSMTAGGPKSRNQILTRLNAEEYKRLAPQLEAVVLSFKERIYEPGKKIEYAYFPESGVISIVKPLADGTLIETRTVGNEGMVGLPRSSESRPRHRKCSVK